jgi:hypothetical protein
LSANNTQRNNSDVLLLLPLPAPVLGLWEA